MRPWIAAGLAAALLAAAPAIADQHHFEFMNTERIGALRIGMAEAEIKRVLPGPPQKGREAYEAADGMFRQQWTYAKQGLVLSVSSDRKGGAKSIDGVLCRAACTLRTARGIGIGSPLAEVEKAYAAEFNQDESKLPGIFVAGSIYGGLVLNFKAGTVSAMHLGAVAE